MITETRDQIKRCSRCKIYKNKSHFFKNKGAFDGFCYYCKDCAKEIHRIRTARLKSEGKPYRKRQIAPPNAHLRKYGLTIDGYLKMERDQNGVCAICRGKEIYKNVGSGSIRKLSIDHCHKTGKVRRLLCNFCNKGLGQFKDSPTLLILAHNYLKRYGL